MNANPNAGSPSVPPADPATNSPADGSGESLPPAGGVGSPLKSSWKEILERDKEELKMGLIIFGIGIIILFAVYFWPTAAKAPKDFCLETIRDFYWSDTPGMDLRFQAPYKPATKEVMERYRQFIKTGRKEIPAVVIAESST